MSQHGGSIHRVLSSVDLPAAILEQRDLIVPLRDQFRLLERAARESGDIYFGARLGQMVKSRELSAFGAWVCAAETLLEAIQRAHAGLNTLLQSSTVLTFLQRGPTAYWSIEFVEPESEGRHHNEFLGIGYMIDVVRVYAGPEWRPHVVTTALPRGTPASELEDIFGTNVSNGHRVPAIMFDAALLNNRAWTSPMTGRLPAFEVETLVPGPGDMTAAIEAVIELALQAHYPRVDWVAARLGLTRRSLQRRLSEQGTTFNRAVENVLRRQAQGLLADGRMPVTDVALQLGYVDPAHFTRAFRRWTGVSPSEYRQSMRNSGAGNS